MWLFSQPVGRGRGDRDVPMCAAAVIRRQCATQLRGVQNVFQGGQAATVTSTLTNV